MDIGEIGERLRRSTVQVRSGRHGSGSGVIFDSSGRIVTNAHVIPFGDPGALVIEIETWNGHTIRARLEKRNSQRDLAILRNDARDLAPASFDDSGRLRAGERVIAVGNPFGFTGALSTGFVHTAGPDLIQSGGLGLAVPVSAVRRLLRSAQPVALGVTLQPVRIPRQRVGIALLVVDVAAGSRAEYASLRPGDVLVGADGRGFTSPNDLRNWLESGDAQLLTVQFLRGDSHEREVTIRLRHPAAA